MKGLRWNRRGIIIRLVIVVCIVLFCIWQNNYLTYSQYTIRSSKISAALDGYKIIQISDLHNKIFGTDHVYLINKIKNSKPDMIVITGDIADANHTDIDAAVEFVEKVTPIAPTYYITGNHEFWLEESSLTRLINGIENAGAVYFDNKHCSITRGEGSFELIGLGDKNLGGSTLHNMMAEVGDEQFTLVLAHEPEYMENYSAAGADLVLSGHVHGGQFRLPFVGGVIAPGYGFFPEYSGGEYRMGDTTMIVSRGLGNSVIPLRLFNFPEVVGIELKK